MTAKRWVTSPSRFRLLAQIHISAGQKRHRALREVIIRGEEIKEKVLVQKPGEFIFRPFSFSIPLRFSA
jgi:hypothetical protein